MTYNRRQFVQTTLSTAAAASIVGLSRSSSLANDQKPRLIIDTHQHLWDLDNFQVPWIDGAEEILQHNYRTAEYLKATRGFNVRSVYMEVDVAPEDHVAEVRRVVGFSKSPNHPTAAAVVGGRPLSADFARYVKFLKRFPEVKGVRQVLQTPETGKGFCLQDAFVDGVRQLGKNDLSFDICMRPSELADGVKLTQLCPETRFIVDHCGNGDPKAFQKNATEKEPWHQPDQWRRDMESFAKQSNVICKISGIIARVSKEWDVEDLAVIVNHCLDSFGPDRVIFGSDWPVCLLGAPLKQWIDSLTQIISERPAGDQKKLWHANAEKIYGLS